MKCEICGYKLTLLLITFVCDRCDGIEDISSSTNSLDDYSIEEWHDLYNDDWWK